jgi:DNA-directed RNA polymerase specialized sigma24 family protein
MTLRHPLVRKQLHKLEGWCAGQTMHVLVADAAATAIEDLQASVIRLSEIRAAGVRAMAEDGWSHREIANELRISRARVDQIINR